MKKKSPLDPPDQVKLPFPNEIYDDLRRKLEGLLRKERDKKIPAVSDGDHAFPVKEQT